MADRQQLVSDVPTTYRLKGIQHGSGGARLPRSGCAYNLSTERYSAPVRPVEFAAFTLGAYNLSTERYSALKLESLEWRFYVVPTTYRLKGIQHPIYGCQRVDSGCAYNLSTERYSAPSPGGGGIGISPVPTTYRLKDIQHVPSQGIAITTEGVPTTYRLKGIQHV